MFVTIHYVAFFGACCKFCVSSLLAYEQLGYLGFTHMDLSLSFVLKNLLEVMSVLTKKCI